MSGNAHQRRKARRAKDREPEPIYLIPRRWMSRDELSLLYPAPDPVASGILLIRGEIGTIER